MATGWLTSQEVRGSDLYWPNSEELPELPAQGGEDPLDALLTSAQVQCAAYAPALAEAAQVPENYRLAQAMQTRALWRSTNTGSGDQMGMDGMSVTVFPMDWTVKALLRPKTGRFVIA